MFTKASHLSRILGAYTADGEYCVSTPEFRRAVRGYDPDEVNRSRSTARDTEDLVNSMVSDAESHMSDLRRQQTMLEDYVQKMRRAATEVDLEIPASNPRAWKI